MHGYLDFFDYDGVWLNIRTFVGHCIVLKKSLQKKTGHYWSVF